jgi:bla regulator protein blaR1
MVRTHFTHTGSGRRLFLNSILAALTSAVCVSLCSAQTLSQSSVPDWQKAAGGKMAFDVASATRKTPTPPYPVGSNFPLGPGDVYVPNGGLLRATNLPLVAYIEFAYKLTENQEQSLLSQLPKWAITDRFDIQGRAQGNPTKDQMRLMMQSLLADRFRLAVHYETRQVPVFALIVDQPGRLGPLLQRHADESPCPTTPQVPSPAPTAPPRLFDSRFPTTCGGILRMPPSAPGRVRTGARNVSMGLIASSMGGGDGVDRPVLDKTGLTGTFDFAIEFTQQINGSSPPGVVSQRDLTGPTSIEAVKEQLGLRLEPQTGPIQFLVIDYVEEPSAN